MPVLVLIRHAKAVSFAPTDHERGLTERGLQDAADCGDWLEQRPLSPDLALVSDARRTMETWSRLRETSGWTVAPRYQSALYTAGEDGLLEMLTSLEDVATVVVVGHNPTVSLVAQLLDDGDGPASTQLAAGGFPPASVAVLEHAAAWSALAPMSCRVTAYRRGGPA